MMVPSHCLASNLWRCNHFSLLFFTTLVGSIKLNRFHPGPEFLRVRVCKIYADRIYLCVHMHVYMLEVLENSTPICREDMLMVERNMENRSGKSKADALSLVCAISFGITCEDLLLISNSYIKLLLISNIHHWGFIVCSSGTCMANSYLQNTGVCIFMYLHLCIYTYTYGFVHTYRYNNAYWYTTGIIYIYIHTVYCTCTVCTPLILFCIG